MKICGTCKIPKPEEDFAWKRREVGTRQSECRPCKKKYQAEWYAKNRKRHVANVNKHTKKVLRKMKEKVLEYLQSHPCVDCGETDPVVLEFDHQRDKVKIVARSSSWKVAEKEIKKCVVRCANCHRRKTAKQLGWFRATVLEV